MVKKVILFTTLIFLLFIYYGESRRFLCLDNGRCITVWKTYNDVCYIIHGKYYGILRPSSISYIQTTNDNTLDIIWIANRDTLIINSQDDSNLIVKNSIEGPRFIQYNMNKGQYNSLFTYFDGTYRRYNKRVDYIKIFTKENYALGNNGMKW